MGALVTSWAGVLTVAAVVAWLGVVGLRVLLGAGNLAGALAAARGETVGPALLATVLVLFVAERRWPAVAAAGAGPGPSGRRRLPRCSLRWSSCRCSCSSRPASPSRCSGTHRSCVLGRLPLVPQVVVVAVDPGRDGRHELAGARGQPPLGVAVALHALHHSQEDMSVFTTFRTHPFVHASYLLGGGARPGPRGQRDRPGRRAHHVRLPRHPAPRQPALDFRTPRPGLREPGLPPPAPRPRAGRRPRGGQLRVRARVAGTSWPGGRSYPTPGAAGRHRDRRPPGAGRAGAHGAPGGPGGGGPAGAALPGRAPRLDGPS